MILNEILFHLNKIGSFDRVNNVPAFDMKTGRYKRMSTYARKGASDISGVYKSRAFYIEVKTPVHFKKVKSYYNKIKDNLIEAEPNKAEAWKRHTWEQFIYLKEKSDHGAVAFVVSSYEDAIKEVVSGNGIVSLVR